MIVFFEIVRLLCYLAALVVAGLAIYGFNTQLGIVFFGAMILDSITAICQQIEVVRSRNKFLKLLHEAQTRGYQPATEGKRPNDNSGNA